MNHFMKKYHFLLTSLLVVLIAACSTTHITSVWTDRNTSPKPYNKLMVLGIMPEVDRALRANMEKHLLNDLKEQGYHMLSAYDVYGHKALQKMSEEEAKQFLLKDGIDAVVTIVLLDKQKEKYYVPERVIHSPYDDHLWSYYITLSRRLEAAAYYEQITKYYWESNLYDLTTNKLVFSVQTQSFDPSSINEIAHEYGLKIVHSMLKNGVIKKQEPKEEKAISVL
jgi:hypothetical protein